MSHGSVMPIPKPYANPLTAAMTGIGTSSSTSKDFSTGSVA